MQRATLKFQLGGLSLFAAATIFLATFLPANNAHAGAPLSGTITLDVQYVCHDGGNRGYDPYILLTKYLYDSPRGPTEHTHWYSGRKGYYDPTECFDLSTRFNRGDIVSVWYDRDGGIRKCPYFRLKYVPNRTDIWVQNRGSTAFDVTCVAKWSLRNNVNSPQKRTFKTFQASEICHDGANRGAQVRLKVSDGNSRWVPEGMTFKGYYTKTQCFKFPNQKNGATMTVYHQIRDKDNESITTANDKDIGHVTWCDKFVVKINRNAKPMWVQTTGHTRWDTGCRARRNL